MSKPLDSGFRRNDGAARIKVAGLRLLFLRHSSESWNPRLQECTPAWMQVVKRRLEQAAEVAERCLAQAAEEGDDGVPQATLIQSELPYGV